MEEAYDRIPHYSEYGPGHPFLSNTLGVIEELDTLFDIAANHNDFAFAKEIMDTTLHVAYSALESGQSNPHIHYIIAERLRRSLMTFHLPNADTVKKEA